MRATGYTLVGEKLYAPGEVLPTGEEDDKSAPAPPADPGDPGDPGDEKPAGYAALTAKELKAEIAKRNSDRAADAQLVDKGNKAALVAVLEEDDKSAPAPPADPGD